MYKSFLFILAAMAFSLNLKSQNLFDLNYTPPATNYQFQDAFGNAYKSPQNLYNDSDNDGYINMYDRHDKNPNVGYYPTPTYTAPNYYNNYKSTSYDLNSGKTIYEGPRGGEYYINSNGNKTYIKKSGSSIW